ncbi:ATP-binding protein [Nocardia sp. NPDC127579]|uniref:ATP-binding protein n=1 Tax=Nocardia sp. NPDC127579 TaxID=3345402 RepID=UPI003635F54B
MAQVLPWIIAPALVAAVVAYYVNAGRRQQQRIDELTRQQRAYEDTLESFAVHTVPAITDAVRRYENPSNAIETPATLENSRFVQCLHWLGDRYADELRKVQIDAEERKRAGIEQADVAVRAEVMGAARDATSGAVRAFGTSVVSLGADAGQVVSAALRQHRDDEVYATLTRIDHTVQQMIRQAQSYVIVCGGLPGRRWPAQSLTDVVGGATGRVRDYLRVRAAESDRVVISRAVEPLVHTLATLLDNALRYSPPTSFVDISFQSGHHGVTVIIDDAGVRMNAEQMEEARQILAGERTVDIHELGPAPKVGFPGVAALARRYGFTVYIDGPNAYGGMRAMVYIPESLLSTPAVAPVVEAAPRPEPVAAAPAAAEPDASGAEPTFAVHEITSGGLPKRRRRPVAPAVAAVPPSPVGPRSEPSLPRPDIAAAWQSGSKTGRAAAEDSAAGDSDASAQQNPEGHEHHQFSTEGTTS